MTTPNKPIMAIKQPGKKEFRYQFLGYEAVGTGKFRNEPMWGIGMLAGGLGKLQGEPTHLVEIKKKVAMVFDKQKGIVSETDIKKV